MTSNTEAGEERLQTLIAKIEPVGEDAVGQTEGYAAEQHRLQRAGT